MENLFRNYLFSKRMNEMFVPWTFLRMFYRQQLLFIPDVKYKSCVISNNQTSRLNLGKELLSPLSSTT